MRTPIYQIDAFTSRRFAGNPAAVMPMNRFLSDATMLAIAAENNLSETAFLVPDGSDYRLRWFTPKVEVPLCGHATLASAAVVMRQAVERHTFSQRLGLYLVSSFAGLAVAMVVAGLYGVLSQLVSYRRREIAVRMALGATRRSVAQIVVRQGSILIGVGLGVGLLLTFPAERLIQSFLYRVHPLDAWTYAGVLLALPTIGLIAALVPAHKAASIQPMTVCLLFDH